MENHGNIYYFRRPPPLPLVWPPRSYSCSFCRRQFKSAQALGGHMNVHRRDRARLKQSPPPQIQESSAASHQIISTHTTSPRRRCGGSEECDKDEDDFVWKWKRYKQMEEIDLELRLGK